MTTSHIFYIPLMILVGLMMGFVLGRRSHAAEVEHQTRRAERRAQRMAARTERAQESHGGGDEGAA